MNAQTGRPAAATFPCRQRAVFALLLLALGLLSMPVFALSARADHVQPVQRYDPAAVVQAYVAAVNAGDLEWISAMYATDAVHVALPAAEGSGVCLGKEQVRLFYEQGVANGDHIEVVDGTLEAVGDRVTFIARLSSDPWQKLGLDALDANVEVVVKDGRFTTHVVMLTPGSAWTLLTALGTIPAPSPEGTSEWEHHLHVPR